MLSLGLKSYDMELWFSDLFASSEMELETHAHVWYGVVQVIIVWYVELVWYDVTMLWYMLCYYRVL